MTYYPPRLVVFDMAGTVVDHGCMAPIAAIREAFEQAGVPISNAQARGPMGLHKRDHIREVMQLTEVTQRWQQTHGRDWTETDVEQLYEHLIPRQVEIALEHTELVPGAAECNRWLREHDILIATTTGYPRSVAQPILDRIAGEGFPVAASCCADEVPGGRPLPWMIFRDMEQLGVYPPAAVIKIGDTVPDMEAAVNAGVRGIGLTESGSEFGLSPTELAALSSTDREDLHDKVAAKLFAAGADAVIRSVAELPALLATSLVNA